MSKESFKIALHVTRNQFMPVREKRGLLSIYYSALRARHASTARPTL